MINYPLKYINIYILILSTSQSDVRSTVFRLLMMRFKIFLFKRIENYWKRPINETSDKYLKPKKSQELVLLKFK